MGGMSHQTIGYLFPMGPYYWVLERIGHAGLDRAAALARHDHLPRRPRDPVPAAHARRPRRRRAGRDARLRVHALRPRELGAVHDAARPVGGDAVVDRVHGARRCGRGGWKYPALFAIAVQLTARAERHRAHLRPDRARRCGCSYALVRSRARATWRATWTVGVARPGSLTLGSLAVVGELAARSRASTGSTSCGSPSRSDRLARLVRRSRSSAASATGTSTAATAPGFWSDARPYYTQRFWLIFVSFAIPRSRSLAAARRAVAVQGLLRACMVLVGMVIAVGARRTTTRRPLGASTRPSRSTRRSASRCATPSRAVPLVALGLAVLLGIGVNALVDALRGRALASVRVVAAAGLVARALPRRTRSRRWPATTTTDAAARRRDPDVLAAAIRYLDARPHDTRVLALPGSPFATYRWGDMKDPVEPGLMDRPYVDRELVPAGSEPARRTSCSRSTSACRTGTSTRTRSRRSHGCMGVGDVELRMDLKTDQYDLIPAGALWQTFTDPPPAGLGAAEDVRQRIPGKLEFPRARRPHQGPVRSRRHPTPVAVLAVEDPLPIVRAKDTTHPLVVDGRRRRDRRHRRRRGCSTRADSSCTPRRSSTTRPGSATSRRTPTLVVTDSNRRRATRWSGMTRQLRLHRAGGRGAARPGSAGPAPGAVRRDDRCVADRHGPLRGQVGPGERLREPEATSTRRTCVRADAMDGDPRPRGWSDPAVPVERERLRIELERPDHHRPPEHHPALARVLESGTPATRATSRRSV